MYLVLCETPHGTRYHVFTETPEAYYEDRHYQFGPMEDPDGAVDSGYYQPDKWDDHGDAEGAAGEDYEEYQRQQHLMDLEDAESEYLHQDD